MDTDTSFDAVYARLRAFSELPAFELLSAAKSRTYFGGISAVVDELTVSELAELSSAELKKLGLTYNDRKIIIQQLEPLVPEKVEDEVRNESRTTERGETAGAASADNTNPGMTLSSVAQEQLLTNILNELAAWPKLSESGSVTLGKFWVDKDVRAPFEELITLKQFSRMSVRSLLAKRSMTGPKIIAITNAIKRAMESLSKSAAEPVIAPASIISTGGGSANDDSLTSRLLAAALKELTPAQRARVLTSVAMPEEKSPRKKPKKRKS